MIVELKSLLPLIYGENLEQSAELPAAPPETYFPGRIMNLEQSAELPAAPPETYFPGRIMNLEQSAELPAAPPVESLQTVLPALAGESSYSLMQGISAAGGEQNGDVELQVQSRVTDLLEQLIAVSEKNAESSERIADLLEQQNSPSALLYD
ncbi:MAG: hypothetical protein IKB99_03340 [Lentisphaeria bacterium]|nr:hypothetical protein [Lentisphaeria bacterium]